MAPRSGAAVAARVTVSPEDVRAIASRAGLQDDSRADWLGFSMEGKGLAWTFMGRDAPKAKRRPFIDILAVRCPLERKDHLIEAAPEIYFDDPHYRGYPAVLVRLRAIGKRELGALLKAAKDAPVKRKAAKKKHG